MIVECEHCSTRFQLDDSRIPDRGIRVRCSRCKHAFFLQRPGVAEEAVVESAAAEAVAQAEGAAPEPSPDLADPTSATASASGSDDEESDWEFNDAIPGEGDPELTAPPRAIDSAAVEQTTPEHSATAAAGDVSETEPAAPDSAFGADDLDAGGLGNDEIDASDLGEADGPLQLAGEDTGPNPAGPQVTEVAPAAAAPESDSDFGSSFDASEVPIDEGIGVEDLAGGDGAESGGDAGLLGPSGSSVSAEELGDPESWDFFAEDEAGAAPAGPAAAGMSSDPLLAAVDSVAEVSTASPASPDMTLDAHVPIDASASMEWMRRVGRGVGWAITGLLIVVAVGRTVPAPSDRVEVPAQLGNLEAKDLGVRWIDTERAGPVLVLHGVLRNPGASPVMPAEALGVMLLDAEGQPVPDVAAPLGTALAAEEIRTLGLADVGWLQQQAAGVLREAPLDPGETREFQALLADPPLSAARVRIGRVALETSPEAGSPVRDPGLADPEGAVPAADAGEAESAG